MLFVAHAGAPDARIDFNRWFQMRDPYSVLGVRRDAGADEIKAAWRSAAKASHPDQNRDDPDATKRFAELSRAFDVLKDPAKRSRYDMQREKADARKREQTIQQQREAAREAAERAKAAKANAERIMADLAKAEAEKAKADKAAAAAQAPKSAEAEKPKTADKTPGAKPAGSGPSPEDVVSRIFGDTPRPMPPPRRFVAKARRRMSKATRRRFRKSRPPCSIRSNC